MVHFFPTPYKDELFYSMLARFHLRSGNISYKETLKDLFGVATITASVFLPSSLKRLEERLPVGAKLTAEEVVYNHTLYPFYTAFLPETRAYQILTSMLEGNGKDIYNRAGIMAGKVKPPSYLRYCPICAKEDMEKYGEMYWHRIHQISGIEICLDHFVWLNNSTVKVQGANKHIAYAASIETCDLIGLEMLNHQLLFSITNV